MGIKFIWASIRIRRALAYQKPRRPILSPFPIAYHHPGDSPTICKDSGSRHQNQMMTGNVRSAVVDIVNIRLFGLYAETLPY